ncbi:MAG: hypothetical protein HQK49_09840 [Oligoflexia bacterium]|nr:hypothetical protein [Oligoflexia bacterium]
MRVISFYLLRFFLLPIAFFVLINPYIIDLANASNVCPTKTVKSECLGTPGCKWLSGTESSGNFCQGMWSSKALNDACAGESDKKAKIKCLLDKINKEEAVLGRSQLEGFDYFNSILGGSFSSFAKDAIGADIEGGLMIGAFTLIHLITLTFVIVSLIVVFNVKMYNSQCASFPSLLVFAGATAVAIAGEITTQIIYATKLKEIKSSYAIDGENPSGGQDKKTGDIQKDAFNFMIDAFQLKQNIETGRAIIYFLSAAISAVAIIVWGVFKEWGDVAGYTCLSDVLKKSSTGTTDSDDKKKIEASCTSVFSVSLLIPFITNFVGGAGAALCTTIGSFVKTWLTLNILSNVGRPIIYALVSGFYLIMGAFATVSAIASKDKRAVVMTMLESFDNTALDSCTADDRNDKTKTKCYCWELSGGQEVRRTDRLNSAVCKATWTRNDPKAVLKDKQVYGIQTNPDAATSVGCVGIDGKLDLECNCKKMKNTSGQNGCMKGTFIPSSLGGASGVSLADMNKSATSILGGNLPSSSSLASAQSMRANAIALAKLAKDNIDDLNKNRLKNGMPAIDLASDGKKALADLKKVFTPELKKQMEDAVKAKTSVDAGAGILNNFVGSGEEKSKKSGDDKDANNSKEKNQSKISFKAANGGKEGGGPEHKKDELTFGMGGNDGRGSDGGSVQNVPNDNKKDLVYKVKSISKDTGGSIWDMISSRYKKSAYQRLFE